MSTHVLRWLVLVSTVVIVPWNEAQVPPAKEQSPIHFPAMYVKTHGMFTTNAFGPGIEMTPGGELSVGNGSVEFRNSPKDAKPEFAFPVREIRALEKRKGPEGFRLLRIKLANGKKFDLAPDISSSPANDGKAPVQAMEDGVSAMGKAIRDMAAQGGVAIK